MADGPDGPLPDPELIARLAGLAEPAVVLGWVVRPPPWLDRTPVPVRTLLVGPGTRSAVAAGRVAAEAVRLSAVPALLTGRLKPAVAVVAAQADGDQWRLAGSPGWAFSAVTHAQAVVVERWPGTPRPGAALVPGPVIGVIEREDPPDPPPAHRTSPAYRRIGELVAGLIPERATVQWGPGVVGASVIASLQVPVHVRSGLVTDEVGGLMDRGLLIGPAQAAYVWGGPRLRQLVDAGQVELHPVEYTHDLTAISAVPRFVAVNTALQVGLDGAANVEVIGGRVVAGPGGHPDFAAGASRSRGGLSVVALAASAGGRSAIVARPEAVSTPPVDVDVVVTEHGVADLRGCDRPERARRLLDISAPEHRADLSRTVQP